MEPQREVLCLGLNFVPIPTKIPVREFAVAVESAVSKLNEEDASDLRMRVCGLLRMARVPSPNMSKQQMIALKKLKEMEDITILPGDKGNTTVLLRPQEYNTNIEELLKTDNYMYKQLKQDPTNVQEI